MRGDVRLRIFLAVRSPIVYTQPYEGKIIQNLFFFRYVRANPHVFRHERFFIVPSALMRLSLIIVSDAIGEYRGG